MGDCSYCGKPAGFLHSKHKECEAAHVDGQSKIAAAIDTAFSSAALPDALLPFVSHTGEAAFVGQSEQRELLVNGWSRALDRFLEHGLPDDAEQARLMRFKQMFGLTDQELSAPNAFPRLVKASTLYDLAQGKIPRRFNITGNLPLNLHKDEILVWAFWNTAYIEDMTHREYVGGSAGMSVRVMKGLYFHTSAFHGKPIDVTTTRRVDSGLFAVTSKNIYFAGTHKSMRIPYTKIVSFQSYSDGIGLVRDAASAKRQAFLTGDGWFVYNLVTNLAKL
jgi:hypothetical protein